MNITLFLSDREHKFQSMPPKRKRNKKKKKKNDKYPQQETKTKSEVSKTEYQKPIFRSGNPTAPAAAPTSAPVVPAFDPNTPAAKNEQATANKNQSGTYEYSNDDIIGGGITVELQRSDGTSTAITGATLRHEGGGAFVIKGGGDQRNILEFSELLSVNNTTATKYYKESHN